MDNIICNNTGKMILLFLLAAVIVPAAVSAGDAAAGHTGIVITPAVINVTNASLPDPSALPEYRPGAEPVKIQAELNESNLPVSKGEMAEGPRTIGGYFDPVLVIGGILILAAIVICAAWYIQRQRKSEEQEDISQEEK